MGSFTRLSESVQTLYAELLDQLRAADADAIAGNFQGSLVSKEIRGGSNRSSRTPLSHVLPRANPAIVIDHGS